MEWIKAGSYIESQNVQSWKGPTMFIKSKACPFIGQPQNSHHDKMFTKQLLQPKAWAHIGLEPTETLVLV